MAGQHRHQSRRSLSVFSISHIRSLSRAGSRQEQASSSQPPYRSASSLSCDPYNQPPAIFHPKVQQHLAIPEDVLQPSASKSIPLKSLASSPKVSKKVEDRQRRPRSWFSLSPPAFLGLPTRSLSVRLPKDTSTSTIGQSVISAPVLTGTTNINVAQAEGVCCRDIVDVGLTAHTETAKRPKEAKGVRQNVLSGKQPVLDTVDKEQDDGKSTRKIRCDATGSILGRKSEDTWRFSAVEKGIARRHAETVNLCREKINKLTGHGHVKRKSINKSRKNTCAVVDGAGNDDIIHQTAALGPDTKPDSFLTFGHGDSDLAFGSLTRSFASAVDKLDFHLGTSTGRMSFIRSKSSIFSLKKKTKPNDQIDVDANHAQQQKTIPANHNITPRDDTSRTSQALASQKLTKQAHQTHQTRPIDPVGFPPEPMQFSERANDYVPTQPAPQYPKGIKVLGMHSNVMEFAKPPSWVTDLPVPPQHTPTVEEVTPVDDDEDEQVIEDAPIYSPSLGDLSQYARSTPPSAQPIAEGPRPAPESPSHAQAERSYLRRLGLRKSKSGLGLLTRFKQGQRDDKSGSLTSPDTEQKAEKAQQLKKSRSMNLAALLRKGETHSMKKPSDHEAPSIPSQTTRPSPLRFETVLDNDSVKSASSTHEVQKRTPLRGNVTPSDRVKRMGIVGMPGEEISNYGKEA